MLDRFFLDQPIAEDEASLGGTEAHHLLHVLRAKPGLEVLLFDGQGTEHLAVVTQVRRTEVVLRVLERRHVDRELAVSLDLAVALPKGDRQRWLVEKTVELGVTRLLPLRTERSVAQPVEQALDRLRRAVVEASKQCARNRLMRIECPRDWQSLLADEPRASLNIVAHPGSNTSSEGLINTLRGLAPGSRVCAAIGPEGGLTEQELEQALTMGWTAVDLGQRILRVETAAIALASLVSLVAGRAPIQDNASPGPSCMHGP